MNTTTHLLCDAWSKALGRGHRCETDVTHIDSKGYVYCDDHALRGRKLTKAEKRTLEAGGTIAYRR